jgi:hypothetical protein
MDGSAGVTMALIDFPNTPATDETFTNSGKTWKYNGYAWVLQTIPTAIPTGGISLTQIAQGGATHEQALTWNEPVAISAATYSSTFAVSTYTTSTPHGFATGDTVAVTGITPSSWNRTATITKVDRVKFFFSLFNGSTGGAYASGGIATGPESSQWIPSYALRDNLIKFYMEVI